MSITNSNSNNSSEHHGESLAAFPMDSAKLQSSSESENAGQQSDSRLFWIENWVDLLDTKYRLPGTSIRFGADFLLGLIPGVGDVISLGMSCILIATMARHGTSKLLAIRMLLNVLLDTLAGSIPILGNLFDLFYKANYRNLKMMREHYEEGKHNGSVWPLAVGILVAFVAAFTFVAWLVVKITASVWQLF